MTDFFDIFGTLPLPSSEIDQLIKPIKVMAARTAIKNKAILTLTELSSW
jgi:hypothetical protein